MVGIEAMNVFTGTCFLDVRKLAEYRELDMTRFENLMMHQKSVALPYEDPVTYGVNAAKPILDAMTEEERNQIEMVITATESSFDFGKSMSTYFHSLLGLNNNCRLFEIKNACYSGVAALQNAANFILAQTSPGAKVLVIATDIARFMVAEGGDALSEDWSFAEPSSGAGAVAMLVSDNPKVFQLDVGATGYYGYEVMDTCRPAPDSEAGDTDLSLLSYLDCCENAFKNYEKKVEGANLADTFSYLAFHTPFGGMVKGAHRNLMRKIVRAKPAQIEDDFNNRMLAGLTYCKRVGNIMGATTMMALASTIDNADLNTAKRVGIFSYGSGCCSEFFSGVITPESQQYLAKMNISSHLDRRYQLTMEQYEQVLRNSNVLKFGTRNVRLDDSFIPQARKTMGHPVLFLKEVKEYHREYEWIS